MKKTTKKTFEPDFTIDFSKIQDYDDLVFTLVEKRVAAGKPIDSSDLNAYTRVVVKSTLELTPNIKMVCFVAPTKKLPWYKRLWNWVTRKK